MSDKVPVVRDIFLQKFPVNPGDPLIYDFLRNDYNSSIEVTYLFATD